MPVLGMEKYGEGTKIGKQHRRVSGLEIPQHLKATSPVLTDVNRFASPEMAGSTDRTVV